MADKVERPLAGRISLWMKEQVLGAGAKGIILGASGGLDSSVVAVLAKMAVGNNATALIMPCHSSPESAAHAKLVLDKFSIKYSTVDLTTVYEQFLKILPPHEGMAQANLRPRLRMTALYYYANARNLLVAGTSNKSEMMVGYFTKWGDNGADMYPIADIYKTELRQFACEIGVPEEIISKPPTADLWSGQTDEDEMGLSYEELDSALIALETDKLDGIDETVLARTRELVESSAHKRVSPPMFRR